MKKRLTFIVVAILALFELSQGQELLLGSNMEDATKWEVSYANTTDTATFQFNYTESKPSAGHGGCLRVTGDTKNYIQTVFYQSTTLKCGYSYTFTGAFKDITSESGKTLNNWWCEVYLDPIAPVSGSDWGTNKLKSFKYSDQWPADEGGLNTDGTFQEDAT